MRVIYISGPYRAPTLRGVINNIRRAEKVAIGLWQMGYAVICPHTNTRLFPEGAGETETRDQNSPDYIQGDIEIIRRLQSGKDALVTLPGWAQSEGSKAEVERAMHLGLKIFSWPTDKERIKKYI